MPLLVKSAMSSMVLPLAKLISAMTHLLRYFLYRRLVLAGNECSRAPERCQF